jgi:GNAT superfamily N-acetyltransferase
VTKAAQVGFDIREYADADEEQVLALLRATLGVGGSFDRSADFWRWKHFENPFGASQLLLAANGEVLGLRAFMRWRFRTPSGTIRAVRAVDTSTHPGYRRLGIFSKLTQASLERARADWVNLIFNTPNPQSMAGYRKLGWQLVGRPRLMMRPLRPLRLAAAVLGRRNGHSDREALSSILSVPPTPLERLFDHADRVEQILGFDDAFAVDGMRTDRSVAFLRWRYGAAPTPRYYPLWTGATPLTGVIIFRPNIRRGLREIMVCEFLIGYGSAKHTQDLIRQLIAMVRADYLVAAASPGTQHWGMLRRSGFFPLPAGAGPNLTVLPLNWPPGEMDPGRLESWRLSLGDLEIF